MCWCRSPPLFFGFLNPHRTLSDQVVIHIRRPEDTPLNSHRRLIWCPFILEDNEENQEDTNQTLALLHEDRVSVYFQKGFGKLVFCHNFRVNTILVIPLPS